MEVQLVEDVRSVETSSGNFRHPVEIPIERVTLADIHHHGMTCYDVIDVNDFNALMMLITLTTSMNAQFFNCFKIGT